MRLHIPNEYINFRNHKYWHNFYTKSLKEKKRRKLVHFLKCYFMQKQSKSFRSKLSIILVFYKMKYWYLLWLFFQIVFCFLMYQFITWSITNSFIFNLFLTCGVKDKIKFGKPQFCVRVFFRKWFILITNFSFNYTHENKNNAG